MGNSSTAIAFTPITLASFRAPGPFQAGLHGPAATAVTLPYPLPSTIAGALAAIAYRDGLCLPTEDTWFGDIIECIKAFHGEDFVLRTGFARLREDLYVYAPEGLVRVKDLYGLGGVIARNKGSFKECLEAKTLKPPIHQKTGITLNRTSKTTVERQLYTQSMLEPWTHRGIIEYVALLLNSESPQVNGIVPFGGERKTAKISTDKALGEKITRILTINGGSLDKITCHLYLATPALTSVFHSRKGAILLDEEFSKVLGDLILERYGLHARIIYTPKNPLSVEVILPGWSSTAGTLRDPALMIPTGTLIEASGRARDMARAIVYGAGEEKSARIGWGTLIPIGCQQT